MTDSSGIRDAERWVAEARAGDAAALEMLVKALQDNVFNLCLRVLGEPSDAEDAAQEILIKVITRLGSFKSKSALSTWVYRIAANHLSDIKRRSARRRVLSLDAMEEAESQRALSVPADQDRGLMEEESSRECMKATLLCLGNDFRLVYVLATFLDIPPEEGAAVMGITPEGFRKKLYRARVKVSHYLHGRCGLIYPGAACNCGLKVDAEANLKARSPMQVADTMHLGDPEERARLFQDVRELARLRKELVRQTFHAAPREIFAEIRKVIRARSA
jgi:RNA polymerase sigma factor (sigma-70 family)